MRTKTKYGVEPYVIQLRIEPDRARTLDEARKALRVEFNACLKDPAMAIDLRRWCKKSQAGRESP